MLKFNKKEKPMIEFISNIPFLSEIDNDILPKPANNFIPDWWKNVPFTDGKVRQCPAFPDLFSSGYIIPMWADTIFYYNSETKECRWQIGGVNSPFGLNVFHQSQFIDHFNHNFMGNKTVAVFQLVNPWTIRTPKGYSVMQLPVFYNLNSDYAALPGTYDGNLVHTDKIEMCYFSDKKEIFIPKGTPIAQIIPYKKIQIGHIVREANKNDFDIMNKNNLKRSVMFKNFYAQNRDRGEKIE